MLLYRPMCERRKILEQNITEVRNRIHLGEQTPIKVRKTVSYTWSLSMIDSSFVERVRFGGLNDECNQAGAGRTGSQRCKGRYELTFANHLSFFLLLLSLPLSLLLSLPLSLPLSPSPSLSLSLSPSLPPSL